MIAQLAHEQIMMLTLLLRHAANMTTLSSKHILSKTVTLYKAAAGACALGFT